MWNGPHILSHLANIYLFTGDADTALDTIERVRKGPQKSVLTPAVLQFDPTFDAIRDHPRFGALLEPYGDESL